MLSNWSQIINAGQEKFGNQMFTFEEVITGRAQDANGNIDIKLLGGIYDQLEKLGGADLDNDGDIDDDDKSLLAKARSEGRLYADAKNGYTLIDAIKKDKKLYRDVLANYLTETAVEDYYKQGTELYKATKDNNNKNNNNNNNDGYFGHSYVPNASGGDQIQVDPTSASKAYNNLEKKTKAWEGAQGYYAYLPKSKRYVRYDSRTDYLLDLKNGKLATNESAWKKIFGEDSIWNSERLISESRVRELEGANMIPRSGSKKYD